MKRIAIGAVAGVVALSATFALDAVAAASAIGRTSGGMSAPLSHSMHAGPTTLGSGTAAAPISKPAPSSTTPRGPAKTGQPNQDCETLGNQPGHSMTAPGSAFNPGGTAGGVYAGEQPQNSVNGASVSQYDVACARPSH